VETGKRINEETIQLIQFSCTIGIHALENFCTDHPLVDWYKQRTTKWIHSILQKGSFFGLDDYQFWE